MATPPPADARSFRVASAQVRPNQNTRRRSRTDLFFGRQERGGQGFENESARRLDLSCFLPETWGHGTGIEAEILLWRNTEVGLLGGGLSCVLVNEGAFCRRLRSMRRWHGPGTLDTSGRDPLFPSYHATLYRGPQSEETLGSYRISECACLCHAPRSFGRSLSIDDKGDSWQPLPCRISRKRGIIGSHLIGPVGIKKMVRFEEK